MTLSLLVSRLLDPMWVVTAIALMGAYASGLSGTNLIKYFLVTIVFVLLPPLILRWWFTKSKGSSGWDIAKRAERPRALVVLLALGIMNIFIARTYGNAFLGNLFIFFELWIVGYFLISLYYKISGHAGAIALATGLAILWFGWTWWPLLLLVPLMGWARVVTKNHTVAQVVAGSLYSWMLVILYGLFS